MITTGDEIPPQIYPEKMKILGMRPELLISDKSCNLGSPGDFPASARDGREISSSGGVGEDAGQGPQEARA